MTGRVYFEKKIDALRLRAIRYMVALYRQGHASKGKPLCVDLDSRLWHSTVDMLQEDAHADRIACPLKEVTFLVPFTEHIPQQSVAVDNGDHQRVYLF